MLAFNTNQSINQFIVLIWNFYSVCTFNIGFSIHCLCLYLLFYCTLYILSASKLFRGLGLWCLTPLSTIFQLHVYRGSQFYLWRKQEYLEKTTHICQKSHNVVSSTSRHVRDSNSQL